MRKSLGYGLLAIPFIGMFWFACVAIGLDGALFTFGGALLICAVIAAGVWLVTS